MPVPGHDRRPNREGSLEEYEGVGAALAATRDQAGSPRHSWLSSYASRNPSGEGHIFRVVAVPTYALSLLSFSIARFSSVSSTARFSGRSGTGRLTALSVLRRRGPAGHRRLYDRRLVGIPRQGPTDSELNVSRSSIAILIASISKRD